MTLTRGARIRRATIRTLRADEPLPEGEPRRYKSGAGYIRLRWKVGPQQYVETYEHRLVAGLPPGDVHHRDHSKDNNDPANLAVLSRSEHAEHHGAVAKSRSRSINEWGGARSQYAYEKRQRSAARREERRAYLARLAELHAAGKTTIEIGQIVGRDSSNVSRALRAAGVAPAARAKTSSGEVSMKVRSMVQARAGMRCEICSANLLWSAGHIHHRLPRGMGGSRAPELHQPSNLLYLCAACHGWIESHREEAMACGWLVSRYQDPSAVPAQIGDRVALLTNLATYQEVA